jgi:hypothetical protein
LRAAARRSQPEHGLILNAEVALARRSPRP